METKKEAAFEEDSHAREMFGWGDGSLNGFVNGLAHMHKNLSSNHSTHVKARYVKPHHLRDKGRSISGAPWLASLTLSEL